MHRFINLIGENTDALAPECPGRLGHLRCQAAVAKEGQKFFGILKRDFVSRSFNSGNTFAGKDAAKSEYPVPAHVSNRLEESLKAFAASSEKRRIELACLKIT